MATSQPGGGEDWRTVGASLRNWGRWGPDDQLGTLNFITPERIAYACSLARKGRVVSMSAPFDAYLPHGASGFRRNPIHLMTVDGGDEDLYSTLDGWGGETERALQQRQASTPLRFADDVIFMSLQAGTQWDALSHAYYDGKLYNGYPSSSITSFGATRNGIEIVALRGLVARGVLLDVAAAHGVRRLEAGYAIEPEEMDEIAATQGVSVSSGDVVVVRTGAWGAYEELHDASILYGSCPGLSWRCADWLYKHEIAGVAADNIAVDVSPSGIPNVNLPLHLIGLRDMGLMLGELWDLERLSGACSDEGCYEFLLVAQPIRFVGAVGSPINPLAVF